MRMYVRALGSAALAFDSLSRNSYNLSMKSIVSEKGQVTIPKALRVSLAISPGTELDFDAANPVRLGWVSWLRTAPLGIDPDELRA